MRNCFVPSCDNVCRDQPRRCMFHPPKNMYEIWKATLPKQKEFKPSDKVCERHFQSNDVIRNFEQIINGEIYRLERGRARLKPNAIPYLNLPSDKEILTKSRKNVKTPSTSVSDTDSSSLPSKRVSKRKQLDEKTSDTNDEKTDDDNDTNNVLVYIPTKKNKNSTPIKDKNIKNDKKENDEQKKIEEKEIIIKTVKIKGKKSINNNKKNNENNVIVIEDDDNKDSPVEELKSIDRKNKIEKNEIIEETTTNTIENNKKYNEKNEIINELHIEAGVYLDDTQLQIQYDSLYDDIFEVTLPNTLWGIHRDPERKLICISYFDIILLKTSKQILINDKYELKIYIFNRLLSEELTTELSTDILSCLINEIDEIKICKNAKQNTVNDKCELKIENNDDELCSVCKEK